MKPWLRAASVLTSVCLMACGRLAGPQTTSRTVSPPAVQVSPRGALHPYWVHMSSVTAGWGLDGSRILSTADGGDEVERCNTSWHCAAWLWRGGHRWRCRFRERDRGQPGERERRHHR